MTSTPAGDQFGEFEPAEQTGPTESVEPSESTEPSEDEELIMFLERDQLVSNRSKPVERAQLGRRATLALWALRIFVLVVSAMVIYTFVAQLN